jgi:glycosyltransferase involved in cell wall biosynthesis
MQQKLSALWIVGWFPTKNNPFAGNFIERHAIACSQHSKIHVIHASTHPIFKAPNQPLDHCLGKNCPYKFFFKSIPQFQWKGLKPLNILMFYALYWIFVLKVLQQINNVDVLHLHAPDKCGFIGVWLKRKLKKPLVLTEHWAIYNTPVPDHFLARNWFFKFQMKTVWKHTNVAAQVSDQLHHEMEKIFHSKKPSIHFPNVVDSLFFETQEKNIELSPFKLVHISNGEPRKNVLLIFESVLALQSKLKTTVDFVGFDEHIEAVFSNLFEKVFGESDAPPFWKFHGRKSSSEIRKIFNQVHCLVMTSSSENAPCVISEALCSNIPVVSSQVGGISQMIDSENGILFELKKDVDGAYNNISNISALSESLMLVHAKIANNKYRDIRENAVKVYGAETISSRLYQLYLSL